ncbi:hypothetical protein NDU88_002161 [Pleurodeles waltl]|uniref:Secreted protein n=1 Tax=Pleurodeles waltl TaxID=8319 RepID=A0AAV7TL17_PLEWA|nr:hypothetical protein NDU88_002161 [Pleurodeles waltl]
MSGNALGFIFSVSLGDLGGTRFKRSAFALRFGSDMTGSSSKGCASALPVRGESPAAGVDFLSVHCSSLSVYRLDWFKPFLLVKASSNV